MMPKSRFYVQTFEYHAYSHQKVCFMYFLILKLRPKSDNPDGVTVLSVQSWAHVLVLPFYGNLATLTKTETKSSHHSGISFTNGVKSVAILPLVGQSHMFMKVQ